MFRSSIQKHLGYNGSLPVLLMLVMCDFYVIILTDFSVLLFLCIPVIYTLTVSSGSSLTSFQFYWKVYFLENKNRVTFGNS